MSEPQPDIEGELAALEQEITPPEAEPIAASVWRLGPGGFLITSVVERHAAFFAEQEPGVIYFYADLEGSAELKHDEGTMQKVYAALGNQGLTEKQIVDSVNAMQNSGIYFREANF